MIPVEPVASKKVRALSEPPLRTYREKPFGSNVWRSSEVKAPEDCGSVPVRSSAARRPARVGAMMPSDTERSDTSR
jgi:hypothetical protein